MSEVPQKNSRPRNDLGKILFLLAGGLLLATLVSCACGPVR